MNVGLAPEVAFFDAADYCSSAKFEGVWSVYPFFDSGNVIMSSIELGLFIVKPDYDKIKKKKGKNKYKKNKKKRKNKNRKRKENKGRKGNIPEEM